MSRRSTLSSIQGKRPSSTAGPQIPHDPALYLHHFKKSLTSQYAKRQSLGSGLVSRRQSLVEPTSNDALVSGQTEEQNLQTVQTRQDDGKDEGNDDALVETTNEETPTLIDSILTAGQFSVDSPTQTEHIFESGKFPPSYKNNDNPKEQACLGICREVLRQFRDLFFDRRPLFLKPVNEFGVEKMVCTTINPTQLPYSDLLDWPDISRFVAGYLDYDSLKPPHMLPTKMFAPQTVLERKRGHSFEYATVLASMLIGAGYDAFVVSGYATREVCKCDLSYSPCPYIDDDQKTYTRPISLTVAQYTVRPPKQLTSRFLQRMELKKVQEKNYISDSKMRFSGAAQAPLPPRDKRFGWRVHAWVLVLPGKREVTEPFFIEASSGSRHPIEWNQYLGIESVWNHRNYYINVHRETVARGQPPCKVTAPAPFLFPITKMTFDIGDSCNWEYIFHWQDLHRSKTDEEKIEERQLGGGLLEDAFFCLPQSWSLKLRIPLDDYLRKYPTGKKTFRYRNAKVDMMADYIQPCGMVRKLWVYTDIECDTLKYSRETFAHRTDLLTTRYLEQATGRVIEMFAEGRADFIKEHQYYVQTIGMNTSRVVVYYDNKRVDGMYRREEGPTFIRLLYGENTDNRLYKKVTRYGPEGASRERFDLVNAYSRPIESIEECYRRNPQISAGQDIHKLTFNVMNDTIEIEYHVADNCITGSYREFKKSENWWDESKVMTWESRGNHTHFNADANTKPCKKEYQLYEMLTALMDREKMSRQATRLSERETQKLIYAREKEEEQLTLCRPVSMACLDRNIRDARLAQRAKSKAASLFRKMDIKHDYLQSYIWSLDLEAIVSKKQAVKVKDECLKDLRMRLLSGASEMKEQFDTFKKAITSKQRNYHRQFISMSAAEEEDCRADIMHDMFVAHILEHRLKQYGEQALLRYQQLLDTLSGDTRLEKYLT